MTSRRNMALGPRFAAIGAGLWLAVQAQSAPAQSLTFSPEAQAPIGVVTQPLKSVRHASEIDAFAKVLDPGPLAQSQSDLETAEAAATASRAEFERLQALHAENGSIAAKDLEAAKAQARSDALKVQILRRQLGLQWGPGVARLSDAQRGRLVAGLARGAIALVHVDTHNDEGQAGARTVRVDIGNDSVRGVVIGPARIAEARLQSSGLIVEVSGPDAILLSVGLTQSAHIEEATAQTGVIIPRSAVIRFRGSDWAYVRMGPAAFERRLMRDPLPEADGFFVAEGFAGGDEVVVKGAAALFAADEAGAGGTN